MVVHVEDDVQLLLQCFIDGCLYDLQESRCKGVGSCCQAAVAPLPADGEPHVGEPQVGDPLQVGRIERGLPRLFRLVGVADVDSPAQADVDLSRTCPDSRHLRLFCISRITGFTRLFRLIGYHAFIQVLLFCRYHGLTVALLKQEKEECKE